MSKIIPTTKLELLHLRYFAYVSHWQHFRDVIHEAEVCLAEHILNTS
jgi:hypothetical protein